MIARCILLARFCIRLFFQDINTNQAEANRCECKSRRALQFFQTVRFEKKVVRNQLRLVAPVM